MLEAFRQLLGERRALLAQIDPNLDGEGRRALASAFYLSRKHRDAEVHACPLPNSLGEMQRLPEAFREVLAEHIELMTAAMVDRPEDADKALADLALMIGGLAWRGPWARASCPIAFYVPPSRQFSDTPGPGARR